MNGKSTAIVATLVLAMLGWLAVEQRLMRSDIGKLGERMSSLEVTLTERIARLEGLFEGHVGGDCEE